MSEEQHGYDLVMPFVTVASKGGPHEDGAYVCGWEMGHLDAYLEHARPRVHQMWLHPDSAPQADLVAMRRGYRLTVTDAGHADWLGIRLERIEEPS